MHRAGDAVHFGRTNGFSWRGAILRSPTKKTLRSGVGRGRVVVTTKRWWRLSRVEMLHLLRCLSFFEAHFAVSPPILRVWIIHWPMICHYLQVHQRAHAASSRIVSGGAAVQFEARLDIRELERNVRWYAEHGLAESNLQCGTETV